MPFLLNKQFNNIKGLDLRSSDLLRSPGAATEATNLLFRSTGAFSKRPGYQHKTLKEKGGSGLHRFNNVNLTTGVITEELLCTDNNLRRYTENTINVTYTGSYSPYYDHYYDADDSVFYFDIYDDNTRVLHLSLGNGLGVSDTTVTQLVAAIDALADFGATVSGSPTTPAAFMDLGRSVSLGASTNISFYTWEAVSTPSGYTNPLANHWANRNSNNFELNCFIESNDVLYISNGDDQMHKYDGSRIYRAGLSSGSIPTAADTAGATFAGAEVFKYCYLYEYTDAKQNVITGDIAESASFTKTGAGDINVTVQYLSNTLGFNTDQAVVNGLQASVTTITVDSGHSIKANDYVYIKDTASGDVVSRKVSSITSTSVTIEGSAISVADNAIISCVKLTLYRSKNGGQLYYFHSDIVNDTNNSSVVVLDQITDANLGGDFTPPVKNHGVPPKCRYMTLWRGQLILNGDKTNVNTNYYSDTDSVEYFPTDNSFITTSRLGGGISGSAALDSTLFVFQNEGIVSVTGDLATDSFRTDPFSDSGIGCVSHHSIREINGRLWFMGKRGIYSADAQSIKEESESISARFNGDYIEKRCNSFSWIDKDLYILSLQKTLSSSGEVYHDSTSKILVYDRYNNAWVEWTNWNLMGGMIEYNNEIYMQGRQLDVLSASKNWTFKVMNQKSFDDYLDHDEAIELTYKSHWEALNDPSVFKKFNRIKVHSLDLAVGDFEGNDFSITVQTEHDYLDSTVSDLTLDFAGGASGWGNSSWGAFPWGEGRLTQLASKLASKKAKSLRVIFTNSEKLQNILISGYELEIATPYDMAIKE